MAFSSEGTGLYNNLDEYKLQSPSDIFDLKFFESNPYPFFRLAKKLYPGNFKPNDAHYFLKLISMKQKLQRIYTQNIDALEKCEYWHFESEMRAEQLIILLIFCT